MIEALLYENSLSASAGQVDVSPLLGNWRNTNRNAKWIKRFTISNKGGLYLMHTYGVGEPFDWGEVEMTTYQDSNGEMAFQAAYELQSFSALLAANATKGIIVIAAFYRFPNHREQSNFFVRDFYFREQ
jgi:hypothetical protein